MSDVVFLETVSSTQDELLHRLRAGERLDAVASGWQTAGRGRHGRTWYSAPGESLALSIAIPPPRRLGAIAFAGMALAARIARRYAARVRWPNDVVIETRKLAGILVESTSVGDRPLLIIGVGVNLGQREFPCEIAAIATSLRLATGESRPWRQEAAAIAAIARRPAPESWSEIADEWHETDDTPGKRFQVHGGEVLPAIGVDDDGRLRLDASKFDGLGAIRFVTAAESYFGP